MTTAADHVHVWLDYVPAVSACVASAVFAFSVAKQRSDRAFAREVEAKKVWREYLQFAFDHPEFSAGYSGSVNDVKQFERYEWFVSKLLFAAEEVLSYSPNNAEWKSVISTQIGYHCKYLKGLGIEYVDHYVPVLREMIRQKCNA